MSYRFTVGVDDSFPLPPSSSPSSSVAAAGLPLKVTTAASCSSDSSGDSGISIQFPPSVPSSNQQHLSSSDRTAEWLGTRCDTGTNRCDTGVNRRQPRVMNADSSSRHSTTSSGSSSGSSGYLGSVGHVNASGGGGGRLSNVTESRLSYVSEPSSCESRTSLDRLDSSEHNTVDVNDLMRRGYSDLDVLYTWLTGMHLDQLYQLFVHAGYDMPTISRMTPEDLTAIGITQPAVRKRLTSEISRLNIDDGIPACRLSSVQEWLRYLNLEEYQTSLTAEGYTSTEALRDIAWEDLEDIGVHKLGHQKKFMLAIDRLKKPPPLSRMSSEPHASPASYPSTISLQSAARQPIPSSPTGLRVRRSVSGEGLPSSSENSSANHRGATEIIHLQNSPVVVRPEMVAINVSRTSNKFSTDESSEATATYESFRGPRTGDGEQYQQAVRDNDDTTSSRCSVDRPSPRSATSSPSVSKSPMPVRPRPQIAPKPRLELRQRRASAGASTADPRAEIAAAAARVVLKKTASHCGESSSSMSNSVEVLTTQPPSGRRLPQSPSAANHCNGHAAMNGQAVTCSVTSLGAASPLRQNSASGKMADSVSSESNVSCASVKDVEKLTSDNLHCSVQRELSRPLSHESPRKAPPVPPKRTNSFKGNRQFVDGSVIDECNRSSTVNHVQLTSSGQQGSTDSRPVGLNVINSPTPTCSPGPFDTNTLPFANENIGTIRQRGPTGDDMSPSSDRTLETTDGTMTRKPVQRPVPMKKSKIAIKNGRVSTETNHSGVELESDSMTSLDADDVFNDIDDMFQGLAQELDQMLMTS